MFNDIKTLGLPRFIYLRFLYRAHMRALHMIGRHKWTEYGPLLPLTPGQPNTFARCDWCGKRNAGAR